MEYRKGMPESAWPGTYRAQYAVIGSLIMSEELTYAWKTKHGITELPQLVEYARKWNLTDTAKRTTAKRTESEDSEYLED